MTLTFGAYTFDHVHYDARGDVLYSHVGEPRPAAASDETPEGHVLRFDEAGSLIGLTIIGARTILERDGSLTVTSPAVRIGAASLARALVTA